MADAKTTPSGAPTAETRKKYGAADGSYPIWNKESAIKAIDLRGHEKDPKKRDDIIRRAAKYAPEQAKNAWIEDHPNSKGIG